MTTQDLQSIKAAMAATNAIFNDEVFGKRNYAALDEVYTVDARILPPGGEMIGGREAIRGFWAGAIEALGASAAVLESVEVMQAGDDVVEIGGATLTMAQDAQLVVKYVVYWKQEDGKWKWHVDIWNTNA